MKNKFSIKEQQDYNEFTEVTALPHLIIGMELSSRHTSTFEKYEMKLESGKLSHLSRVLFIGPSKYLKDYYAPSA
jgi:hypothetical protein